jgi:hypothetical protein
MKISANTQTLKTRIEHISFQSNNEYMDIESHDGYIDITIGGTENSKFAVTLEEWQWINEKVIELFKQQK